MGCFDDCIADMMAPYGGNTPMFSADKTDATVTIVQEAYDNGIKVTRIQTPPRTDSNTLMEAIDTILGIMDYASPLSSEDDKEKPSDKEGGGKNDNVQSDFGSESKSKSGDKPDKSQKSGGFGQTDESDGMADEKESVDKS